MAAVENERQTRKRRSAASILVSTRQNPSHGRRDAGDASFDRATNGSADAVISLFAPLASVPADAAKEILQTEMAGLDIERPANDRGSAGALARTRVRSSRTVYASAKRNW